MKMPAQKIILVSLVFSFFLHANAQLQLHPIFSNGAVLQRDMPIPVWGTAGSSDTVKVTLGSEQSQAIADASGNWEAVLPAMSAGGPFTMKIESGSSVKTLSNIYIGDVWLASGQSNMELTVSQVDNATAVINAANDQKIRQFKVPKGLANEPSEDLPSGSAWTPATSTYVRNFTAVGYFFARDIRAELNIPIGIINTSYGGSRIETWMSEEMLGYDEQNVELGSGEAERQPTVAYNKMLHPLTHVPIKGFLWYQGESNADNMEDALAYADLFQTMITGWRALWGEGDIPFIWVQLPGYGTIYDTPQTWDAWPQLRAGQSAALSLPNTGEVITIDLGDVDIHPTNKEPVGQRMALVARKVAYGEDLVYSGPRYKSNLLQEDGKIALHFTDIGSGLMTIPDAGNTVEGFALADENGNLAWTSAEIDGDQVLVSTDAMANPVKVRYAWEYHPSPINLYNVEQLPAAPFFVDINPGFGITTFKAGRTTIEKGQTTTLTWQVFGSDNITLDGTPVDSSGTISISPDATHSYQMIAVNRDNPAEADTAIVTVEVLDPNQINRALNHPVKASSFETNGSADQIAEFAVDGDFETRWSSAWGTGDYFDPNTDDDPDDEWIYVDFSDIIDIERVILYWESAFGKVYDLDISFDGYLWETVYHEANSDGDQDNIIFNDPPAGRFIRIHGTERGTEWGYSLYEIAVYGPLSSVKPPTVSLISSKGIVLTSGDQTTITADTKDSDGTVEQVSFYVDGEWIATDTEAPFSTDWQIGENSEYALTAIAVDNDSFTVQSDTLVVYLNDGTFTTYEAESALTTGTATKGFSGLTSGGAYMKLQDGWTITWDNIDCPATGEYVMSIGYQLTYESPKNQFLVVNGDTVGEVEFTAPNTSDWLQKGVTVNLVKGTNTIAFHAYWGWMSFDFIAIKGTSVVSVENKVDLPNTLRLLPNYPNPFNPTTTIGYQLPSACEVELSVYNTKGQKVATLVKENQPAGTYQVEWDASRFSSGMYLLNLKANGYKEVSKCLLMK